MFISRVFKKGKILFFLFIAISVILICLVWNNGINKDKIFIKDNNSRVEYLLSQMLSVENKPLYKKDIIVDDYFVTLCPKLKGYDGQKLQVYCYKSEQQYRVLVFEKNNWLICYYKYSLVKA